MAIRDGEQPDESGFTLIELLVVIIIIGILAAIAIPIFLNQRQKAVDASLKSDLKAVANEMESYYGDSQNYPSSLTQTGNMIPIGPDKLYLSPSISVSVATPSAPNTFCLKASSTKTSTVLYFDSYRGGLQPVGVTCP